MQLRPSNFRWPAAALIVLVCAAVAAAHPVDDEPRAAGAWWLAWSAEPAALIGTTLAAMVYALGLARLWRSAGLGRGVARWQVACFAAGLAVLLLALTSPIDHLSAHLGWVHMVQHTLLMLIAAPLLVAGSPAVAALWAMPGNWGRRLARCLKRAGLTEASRYLLWQPLVLWTLYALVLWAWHLPALYGAALRNPLVHDAQHLAFLLGACLYWRVVVDPLGRVRLTPPLAVVYLFTMSLQGMLLGVFMAVSPRVWYAAYADTAPAWGLTALADQQIAGYIMWMPACAVYGLVAAAIFGVWLHRSAGGEQAIRAPSSAEPPPAADGRCAASLPEWGDG